MPRKTVQTMTLAKVAYVVTGGGKNSIRADMGNLYSTLFLALFMLYPPQWGNVEIKVPSVGNSELTDGLLLKPGVGQNIAMHASPAARNLFFVLICSFTAHSPSCEIVCCNNESDTCLWLYRFSSPPLCPRNAYCLEVASWKR